MSLNYNTPTLKVIKSIQTILSIVCVVFLLTGKITAQSTAAYINTELISSEEIVTIDSITGIANKTIPFDYTFYLRTFIRPSEEITGVEYFRVKSSDRDLIDSQGRKVDTFFVKNKKELYIKVPPLKPGKSYDFLLRKKISGATFQNLVNVHLSLLKQDITGATTKYNDLSNSLSVRTGNRTITFQSPNFNATHTYFTANLMALYKDYYDNLPLTITLSTTRIDNDVVEKSINTSIINFRNREQLIDLLLTSINDMGLKNENYIKNLDSFILPLQNIRNSTTTTASLLLLGRLPINFGVSKRDTAASTNLIARLDNINTSQTIIGGAIELVDYLISIKNATSLAEALKLKDLKNDLNAIDVFLKRSSIKISSIIKAINNLPEGQRVIAHQWISATSINNNFVTRVEEIVVPDVGIAVFGSLRNLSSFKEVRPYYGVNINLRPVNKNIRLRNLRKKDGAILTRNVLTPWHYFSVMLGLTIGGSIQEEGERDDLFGNNSLLVGIGFRLNHTIRISAGSVIFRANNPNPLIADKSIATAPFASISFDIKIQSIISSLSNVILK